MLVKKKHYLKKKMFLQYVNDINKIENYINKL